MKINKYINIIFNITIYYVFTKNKIYYQNEIVMKSPKNQIIIVNMDLYSSTKNLKGW